MSSTARLSSLLKHVACTPRPSENQFAYARKCNMPTAMILRTFVAFVATFPTDRGEDDSPAGKELADFVAAKLRNAGVDVHGPEEREGWAWDITANVNGTPIDTIVGFVDDMDSASPRQWLITNDSRMGLWSRMFGSRDRWNKRESALRRYCETLHATLTSDPRFSHILWYDNETFDKPRDEPSSSP